MNDAISPAFDEVFRKQHEKQEAIVVFRPVDPAPRRLRGRLRALNERLLQISEKAAAQAPVQERVLSEYARQHKGPQSVGRSQVNRTASSILNVAEVEVTKESIQDLAARPEVLAVMPNQPVRIIKPRAVDFKELGAREIANGATWGLDTLEIPAVWETSRGDDIRIAVLDTGAHADHPALRNKIENFVVIDPLGRRIDAKPAFDCGSHGTHVCGVIAGGALSVNGSDLSIGTAPGARLLVGAVLLGNATLRTLLEGIAWAVEQGADIINMSLGFTYYEPLFAEVFAMLLDQYDVLPVCAIGNENHGNSSSPGNSYNALSVGAAELSHDGGLSIASFSSGASFVFPGQQHGLVTKPDVVAPGAQILSCVPPQHTPTGVYDYSYMDGTSMAAPHVAGTAALLMASHPLAPLSDIVAAIKETALHPQGNGLRPDNRWGHGMVRPREALKSLASL